MNERQKAEQRYLELMLEDQLAPNRVRPVRKPRPFAWTTWVASAACVAVASFIAYYAVTHAPAANDQGQPSSVLHANDAPIPAPDATEPDDVDQDPRRDDEESPEPSDPANPRPDDDRPRTTPEPTPDSEPNRTRDRPTKKKSKDTVEAKPDPDAPDAQSEPEPKVESDNPTPTPDHTTETPEPADSNVVATVLRGEGVKESSRKHQVHRDGRPTALDVGATISDGERLTSKGLGQIQLTGGAIVTFEDSIRFDDGVLEIRRDLAFIDASMMTDPITIRVEEQDFNVAGAQVLFRARSRSGECFVMHGSVTSADLTINAGHHVDFDDDKFRDVEETSSGDLKRHRSFLDGIAANVVFETDFSDDAQVARGEVADDTLTGKATSDGGPKVKFPPGFRVGAGAEVVIKWRLREVWGRTDAMVIQFDTEGTVNYRVRVDVPKANTWTETALDLAAFRDTPNGRDMLPSSAILKTLEIHPDDDADFRIEIASVRIIRRPVLAP